MKMLFQILLNNHRLVGGYLDRRLKVQRHWLQPIDLFDVKSIIGVFLGNIGTIVRTGSAFGVSEYLATHKDFDPYYRKAIEASRGRVFHSHFKLNGGPAATIEHLRRHGFQIITTSPYGSSIQSLNVTVDLVSQGERAKGSRAGHLLTAVTRAKEGLEGYHLNIGTS